MNQPFLFMPNLNPFADNGKAIKKSIRTGSLAVMAVTMGLAITAALFGTLFFFGKMGNDRTFYYSDYSRSSNISAFSSMAARLLLITVTLIVVFIGVVNLRGSFRQKDSPDVAISFLIFSRLLMFMVIILSVWDLLGVLFNLSAEMYSADMKGRSVNLNFAGNALMFRMIPAVIWLLWAISGIILHRSFRVTCLGLRLEEKGAGMFGVVSVIAALSEIVQVVLYDINGFTGGLFYRSDNPSALTDAVANNWFAIVMFNVFFAATAAALIAAARFAGDYNRAVGLIKLSFRMGGSNLYMNEDSAAAAYFQQFYQQENPSPEQPPVPVQPEFNRVQVQGATKICKSCGMQIPADCTYCPECGTSVTLDPTSPSVTLDPTSPSVTLDPTSRR